MNNFLEARYKEAKARYLNQCAYMHETNLAYAEKKGGVDNLTGTDKTRFEGIQGRLVDLVAYSDAAQEYIEALQTQIDDLLDNRRRIVAEIQHIREVETSQYNVIRQRLTDEAKEERRALRRQQVEQELPHLFHAWTPGPAPFNTNPAGLFSALI